MAMGRRATTRGTTAAAKRFYGEDTASAAGVGIPTPTGPPVEETGEEGGTIGFPGGGMGGAEGDPSSEGGGTTGPGPEVGAPSEPFGGEDDGGGGEPPPLPPPPPTSLSSLPMSMPGSSRGGTFAQPGSYGSAPFRSPGMVPSIQGPSFGPGVPVAGAGFGSDGGADVLAQIIEGQKRRRTQFGG